MIIISKTLLIRIRPNKTVNINKELLRNSNDKYKSLKSSFLMDMKSKTLESKLKEFDRKVNNIVIIKYKLDLCD